jgi:1-deoxy-D-xylulose-5-phosphate reductoisomerase
MASGATALDFRTLAAMTFEPLDAPGHAERYAGIHLAWEALRSPAGTTAVLNAANEVAVEAFLARRIRFDQIHAVNLRTLEAISPAAPGSLDDLLALDSHSRAAAGQSVASLSH